MSIHGEQAWQSYHRDLYPEFPQGRRHWCGTWKTSEMCMGLFGERQAARQEWFRNRRGQDFSHPTAVVTYHASPVRSSTVKVCLQCLWVSRDLNVEHDQFP